MEPEMPTTPWLSVRRFVDLERDVVSRPSSGSTDDHTHFRGRST
jgi:hypothetical protein